MHKISYRIHERALTIPTVEDHIQDRRDIRLINPSSYYKIYILCHKLIPTKLYSFKVKIYKVK